jgi:arylsulfatase A-like enzyme
MKERTTLASVLRGLGYYTMAVNANSNASHRQRLDLGFDLYVSRKELRKVTNASSVTNRAITALGDVPADTPLLLWVHYTDPHFPYKPHPLWENQPEARPCRDLIARIGQDPELFGEVQGNRNQISSRALPSCQELYDVEVTYTDFHLGRLVEHLEETGRLDSSLLVFSSDHGENMGEDGLYYEHGPSLHDAGLIVPLIIKSPGLTPHVDNQPIRIEDLMPTILGLLEVPQHDWPPMDGLDLSRRIMGRESANPEAAPLAFAESGSYLRASHFISLQSGHQSRQSCINHGRFSLCARKGERPRLYDHEADPELTTDISADFPEQRTLLEKAWELWPPQSARERSVRTPRFKLVEHPRLEGGYHSALYDLQADPAESRDVSSLYPDIARRLQAELDHWTAGINGGTTFDPDEEITEGLRALGYIE